MGETLTAKAQFSRVLRPITERTQIEGGRNIRESHTITRSCRNHKIRHEYERINTSLIKLVITIRFLATGNRYQYLSNSTINSCLQFLQFSWFCLTSTIMEKK